jgi:hypothetical protein
VAGFRFDLAQPSLASQSSFVADSAVDLFARPAIRGSKADSFLDGIFSAMARAAIHLGTSQ